MKEKDKSIRIEVVLLALCFGLLFMIPGLVCLNSLPTPWDFIAFGFNIPVAFLVSVLLTNKLLTGKFTNKGKLWFDN